MLFMQLWGKHEAALVPDEQKLSMNIRTLKIILGEGSKFRVQRFNSGFKVEGFWFRVQVQHSMKDLNPSTLNGER